jgi:hypothetical protein
MAINFRYLPLLPIGAAPPPAPVPPPPGSRRRVQTHAQLRGYLLLLLPLQQWGDLLDQTHAVKFVLRWAYGDGCETGGRPPYWVPTTQAASGLKYGIDVHHHRPPPHGPRDGYPASVGGDPVRRRYAIGSLQAPRTNRPALQAAWLDKVAATNAPHLVELRCQQCHHARAHTPPPRGGHTRVRPAQYMR